MPVLHSPNFVPPDSPSNWRTRWSNADAKSNLPGAAEFDLRPLLDLVALGTIADLVPLIGENRILVSAGLQRLNQTQRPGTRRAEKSRAIAAEARHVRSRLSTRAATERRRAAGNGRGIPAPAARPKSGRGGAARRKIWICGTASGRKLNAASSRRSPAWCAPRFNPQNRFRHRRGTIALAHRRGRHRRVARVAGILPADHHHRRRRRRMARFGPQHCRFRSGRGVARM